MDQPVQLRRRKLGYAIAISLLICGAAQFWCAYLLPVSSNKFPVAPLWLGFFILLSIFFFYFQITERYRAILHPRAEKIIGILAIATSIIILVDIAAFLGIVFTCGATNEGSCLAKTIPAAPFLSFLHYGLIVPLGLSLWFLALRFEVKKVIIFSVAALLLISQIWSSWSGYQYNKRKKQALEQYEAMKLRNNYYQ